MILCLFNRYWYGGPSVSWFHDDVIKWKHFPRYWPFVRGIHRSLVNSPHNGQWHGALIFSLICAWINGWVNNCEAGDLRCHRAHYDVNVMHMKYMHKYSWKESVETHTFFWSNWGKYFDIMQQPRFGSTSGSCSIRYSIAWTSRLCAVLLIAGVSAFVILMMSFWHLTVRRYVLRYVLYHNLYIEIRIILWGTHIVTPLFLSLNSKISHPVWQLSVPQVCHEEWEIIG